MKSSDLLINLFTIDRGNEKWIQSIWLDFFDAWSERSCFPVA